MADPKAPLASVQDLGGWIGETIADDSADAKRAAMCLRAASTLVRDEVGRTWLNQDGNLVADVPETAVMVTLYCASRVYDNREAMTDASLDDSREGFKVQEAGAYLTATERRQLATLREAGRGGLSTIRTVRDERPVPSGLVPTDTPGVAFPWY